MEGIKRELSAPGIIKEMAKAVRVRLRQGPDRTKLNAELARINSALDHCIDSIAELGGSKALLAKVKQLETDKARIADQLSATPATPLIPNVEKLLRERVKVLETIPREDLASDLKEAARTTVKDILGEVKVIEDGDHVIAEFNLARVVYKHGAEERT